MIPSARTLPLPAPAPERADLPSSTDGDSRSDASTLSFASHLDQFVTPVRPHGDAPAANRSTATLAQRNAAQSAQTTDPTGKATANAQASADTHAQLTASPADGDAPTPDDANKSADKSVGLSKKDEKNEDKTGQDKQTVAANSISAIPLPLTLANLAITNSVAPLPVPVQQTSGTVPLPNAPTTSTPVSVPGTSLPANPLNLPGVSMDSRSAVQTAAPGVVNALPQNSAAAAQVSLSTLPTPTAPKTSFPTDNAVSTLETPVTAPPAQMNVPISNAPVPVATLSVALPQTIASAAPTAPANPIQQTTAKQAETPSAALSVPLTGSVSQETANGITVPSAGEKAIGEKTIGEKGEKPAEVSTAVSTAEQHLGGIERLFTLGANKITDARPSQATEIETGKSDALVTTPATVATLLTQNASDRQQMPVPVSIAPQVHPAATANGVPAASLSLAGIPTLASGQNPAVSTLLVTATLAASAAAEIGALSQPADGIRNSNGAATLAPTDLTTGANSGAGGVLLAPVGAQGKTDGDTSADGERQADSHHEKAASTAAENTTDSAAQANSANPFNSLRASGETAATNAVTTPTGSSQIARAQVVEQVTRHLESMRISNGEGEMRLQMTPHNLGNVQISVATHQNGVVARIAVESAQIQQAMEGAKEHLRATLEARGLRVSSVEVTVTPNLIGNDSAAFAGQRGWQPTGERAETLPGYSRPNNTGQASDDSLAPVPIAAAVAHVSLSRLDYRA
jgi:Flagellar hook-length control protein FliK